MRTLTSYSFILLLILFGSGCSQNTQTVQNQQYSTNTRNISNTTRHQASTHSQNTEQSVVKNIHPARLRMINIAKSTLGAPYKWGGNSPQKGFDCSGLMSYVHKNALGLKIPRTAAKQRDFSRTISYAQLQPGDMLFFKTGKNTNHVGVYIGNRKFIHAPSGGKRVKVASMDSSYWYKRFVKFGTYL